MPDIGAQGDRHPIGGAAATARGSHDRQDRAVAAAALAGVRDGATVMIGGFGLAGMPSALIDALIAQGASDLTIVSNNAGNGDTGLAALLKAEARAQDHLLLPPPDRLVASSTALYRAGKIELEVVPQGNLAERIRAAGAGIGAFFTPDGLRHAAGRAARRRA